MKAHKGLVVCAFVLMFCFSNTFAQTCYDPNYGYYNCDEDYSYYPDQGQAVVEGFVFGAVLGGLISNGDNNNWGDGRHNNHGHGNQGGGNHRSGNQGGGSHGGGGRGGHH